MMIFLRKKSISTLSKAVIINYISKLWTMLAGLISIWFIARYTSRSEQGLYYTINSILALQIFIELGFNYAVIRIIGNKFGQINSYAASNFNSIISHSEISTLCTRFLRQSIAIAAVTVCILTPVGIIYFSKLEENSVTWQLWVPLVGLTALNILLNTILSIIEGVGFISEVAIIRLWQATALGISLWATLWAGEQLHALIWANAVSSIIVLFLILKRFFKIVYKFHGNQHSRLKEEEKKLLRKYMTRIAISGASGYLIFQVFTPLISLYSGTVEAGRFAMTLQIITSLNIFGLVPLTSSAPRLAKLIGSGDSKESMILFKRILISSSVLMLIICLALAASLAITQSFDLNLAQRVLPLKLFMLMLAAALANHLVFSLATYLRSFLDDPFWILSIVSAIIGIIGAYFSIREFGYSGAVYIYFLNCTVIGLGGAAIIFKKRQNA